MAAAPPPAAKQAAPFIKHIILYGLGNATHPLTRHSVGQMTVTSLAKRLSFGPFSKDQKLSGELSEGHASTPDHVRAAEDGPEAVTVTLVKSKYLMNDSGRTLKPLLQRYPLGPTTAHFILYDHLEFPDDKVQIRKGGSASGQNGMRSCLKVLGPKNAGEVFQVRIGIDRPSSGMDVADYVLSRAPLDFINRYAQNGSGVETVWNQILAAAYPAPGATGGGKRQQTKEEMEAAMRAAKKRREEVRRERERRAAQKAAAAGGLLTPPSSDDTP